MGQKAENAQAGKIQEYFSFWLYLHGLNEHLDKYIAWEQ